jgi:hypothetical protein
MLKEDLAESAKVPDEIVGLDFDPYINGQETPTRYLDWQSNSERQKLLG